jgi:DNA/RNA-binding domain of Phe-tRNA-synthetase-like protein
VKLSITPGLFALFPDARVALVVVRGLDNHPRADRPLQPRLQEAQASAVARLGGLALTEHPRIHCWREAYRAFGAKPKDYPSSIENLVRRALKGDPLRCINPLVDLYNVVSLTHLLPAGGEDLDAIEGDIVLTRASADESPVKLLGESEERAPKPGEVIYKDDRGAICRRWNWKEADRTKLTAATRRAFLVIEGLPPVDRGLVRQASEDLAALIAEHCGGRITTALIDREWPSAVLEAAPPGEPPPQEP